MTPAGVTSEALTIIDACGLDRTKPKVATGPMKQSSAGADARQEPERPSPAEASPGT